MKINNKIIKTRSDKLYYLRKIGFDYPNKFKIKKNICFFFKNFYKNKIFNVSGRLISKRNIGKTNFFNIKINLCEIQLFININILKKEFYDKLKYIDIGDIILAKGTLFKTKIGILSIRCHKIILISKSIRPIPNKFYGLIDQEICYRQRYIDLLTNNNTVKLFIKRSKIINYIRMYMEKKNFLEVETPILHNIIGGANAKPFITFHNSLEMKIFLRISPEIYLKKLLIGGFDKIFEINKNFRNEGTSNIHNPEFTMMESYIIYTNYKWQINFLEKFIKNLTKILLKTPIIKYLNKKINFKKNFSKLTITEAILKYLPYYSIKQINSSDFLKEELLKYNPNFKNFYIKNLSIDMLKFSILEEKITQNIWNPTFILNYPIEISPLAKKKINIKQTERFEFFITGKELANAFSELNDPEEQKLRFLKQLYLKTEKLESELIIDNEYIKALEYAMPPTSGCGIGIDRLIMILTNKKTIKDVILFPQLKFNN